MSAHAALAALALLVAVGATGCGGDEPAAGSDAGFERFQAGGVSLEYPAGWTKDDAGAAAGEKGRELLNVRGEPGDSGLFARVRVLEGERSSFPSAVSLGKSIADSRPFELREGRLVSDGRDEVRGAESAWRIVTEFESEAKDGKPVKARLSEVVAVTPEREVTVTVAAPEGTLSPARTRRILDSLALR